MDPCDQQGLSPVAAAAVDNTLWAGILAKHVTRATINGIISNVVDYETIRLDPSPLQRYLQQLCQADPSTLPAPDAVALLVNLYNALMMLVVVLVDPESSVREIADVWTSKFGTLNGRKVSLDDIEHGMVRQPQLPAQSRLAARAGVQGRAHAGFVCASLSCPDLMPEPYEGPRLAAQLSSQTRLWLTNPTKNPGPAGSALRLSKIFDWYGADFVAESGSVQNFVASHSGWTGLSNKSLDFIDYNWALNAANGTGKVSGSAPHSFALVWSGPLLSMAAAVLTAVE